jgi:hypothetical protein
MNITAAKDAVVLDDVRKAMQNCWNKHWPLCLIGGLKGAQEFRSIMLSP